jgi:hypothetical protein
MERPVAKGIRNPTARPFSPTNSKPWNGPRVDSLSTSGAWEARSIVEAIDSRGQGSAIHQPTAEPASIRQPFAEPAPFGSPLAEKSRHKMPDIGRWTIPTTPLQAPTRTGDYPPGVRSISRRGVKHPISGGARRPVGPDRKAQEGAERPETPHCARARSLHESA